MLSTRPADCTWQAGLRAKEAGCDVMWLGVWEYNPRAQRFYEKNGFRIVGSHVGRKSAVGAQ